MCPVEVRKNIIPTIMRIAWTNIKSTSRSIRMQTEIKSEKEAGSIIMRTLRTIVNTNSRIKKPYDSRGNNTVKTTEKRYYKRKKQYYETKKEQILGKMRAKVTCEICKVVYSHGDRARHWKSLTHQRAMEAQSIV